MQLEEMVRKIKAGEIDIAELWLRLRPFICAIAKKYQDAAELPDLLQEAFFGVKRAVELYDYRIPFSTYVRFWIRQSMARYVENCGYIIRKPVHMNNLVYRLRRVQGEYKRDTGRPASDLELTAALGVDLEQLARIKEAALTVTITSLDEPVKEGEETTLGDMIPGAGDMETEVIERVDEEKRNAILWEAVGTLPDRQADIIRRRYQDEEPRREIAQSYGISGQRVQALEEQAIRKLRRQREIRKQLEPYLDSIRYSRGIAGGGVGAYQRRGASSTELAAAKAIDYTERLRKNGMI